MSPMIGIEFFALFFPFSLAAWIVNVMCQAVAVAFAIASVSVPCRPGPQPWHRKHLAEWAMCAASAAVITPLIIGLLSPFTWVISLEAPLLWPWAILSVACFSVPSVVIAGLALMVARIRGRGLPGPLSPTRWYGSSGNLLVVVILLPVVAFVFLAATLLWYS
jgi:hypothetical protein